MKLTYDYRERVILALYRVCDLLDRFPSYSFRERRYILAGMWGCRLGVSALAFRLDKRWEL